MSRKSTGIDNSHHEGVDPAADESRQRAVDDPDDRGHDGGGESDNQRSLATKHEAAQHVESGVVGAERGTLARWGVLRGAERRLGIGLIRVVQQRSDEAEDDEEDDDEQSDDGQFVLDEDPKDLSPHSPDRRGFTSLGCSCRVDGRQDVAQRSGDGLLDRSVGNGGWAPFVRRRHVLPKRIRGSATA
jgi:hypothetical protein